TSTDAFGVRHQSCPEDRGQTPILGGGSVSDPDPGVLMGAPVKVDKLHVTARAPDGTVTSIVSDVSFSIEPGQVLALIGESGSGKTTIARALMGHASRGCRREGGSTRM